MNNNKCGLLLMLLFPVMLLSCSKDQHTTTNGDWLFPVAKGSLSLTSLSELKNLKYSVQIPAISIGQPVGVPVSSPGLSIAHVGPFALQITPWLKSIDIDSLEINTTLRNIFPIPIGAGTQISIRNSKDVSGNGNIIGSTIIANDVAPNAQFSIDFKAANKTFGDSVFFFLDNFVSPPYKNVVFAITPTELVVTLKVITASKVELYSNKVFSSVDTMEFKAGDEDNLGGGTGGAISDTSVSGFLNVFLDNGLPAHVSFQAYFLDAGKTQIIDSLFTTDLKVAGANTDAAGTPLAIVSTVTKVNITQGRINNIKKAAYTVTRLHFNTLGYTAPWVTANKNAKLDVQITGDLNIKIRF
jgi:hypothetical protein